MQPDIRLSDADRDALASFDTLPDSAFVRLPVVQALHGGVSDETIRRRVKSGELPQPKKFGPRLIVFNVGELRRAMAAQWAAAENA